MPLDAEALKRIGELYAFEGEIRGRLRTSAASSYNSFPSLLDSLHQWLQATSPSYPASRRSWRRSAIRWRALLRYSEGDRIEIDSNAAERILRAAALGRKNYCLPDRIPAVNVRQ